MPMTRCPVRICEAPYNNEPKTQPRSTASSRCGEKSEMVSVYAIDGVSGSLRLLRSYPGGKGANWVSIVALR